MTENPCYTCREDCAGGIIYGNCQHFRTWFKAHNALNVSFNSRFPARQDAQCQYLSDDDPLPIQNNFSLR